MPITTSQRLNPDQVLSALPSGSFTFTGDTNGLPTTQPKTLTPIDGATDSTLQTAITSAAAAFVDYAANKATIQANASAKVPVNVAYLAVAVPTVAQTTAQLNALTRAVNALIYTVGSQFSTTNGT